MWGGETVYNLDVLERKTWKKWQSQTSVLGDLPGAV